MAEDQNKEQEPSIEEILDSIRQIISDDSDTPVAASQPEADAQPKQDQQPERPKDTSPPPTPAPPPAPAEIPSEASQAPKEDEDVVMLTERLPDDEPEETPATKEEPVKPVFSPQEPKSEPSKTDNIDMLDEELLADSIKEEATSAMVETRAEPVKKSDPPSSDKLESYDALIAGEAEETTLQAFKELAEKAAIERSGSVTIEDIVREEIRPMLRVWMDQNLQGIVEKMLRREMDRIVGRLDDL